MYPLREPHRLDQTVLHDPEGRWFGNCVRAGVASVLGLPLDEVPPFEIGFWCTFFDWRDAVKQWAGKVCRLHVTWFVQDDDMPPPGGFALAAGSTVRGTRHLVVYRNGKLWHDPHPSRSGIIRPEYWVVFEPATRGPAEAV